MSVINRRRPIRDLLLRRRDSSARHGVPRVSPTDETLINDAQRERI